MVQADALDYLAGQEGRFDLITGQDIVEHFRTDEVLHFLDLCLALLKPGGRFVLQTPNAESPWGTHHRYNDLTHELGFNPNALIRLLALVGFEAIEARELEPVPIGYSAVSTLRWFIWQRIRAGLIVWNLAETGDAGAGAFTRVFLANGETALREAHCGGHQPRRLPSPKTPAPFPSAPSLPQSDPKRSKPLSWLVRIEKRTPPPQGPTSQTTAAPSTRRPSAWIAAPGSVSSTC